ncbi:MAG: PhzF family phenazine biosynthesis protein [Pseudomonadota bacterium]
MQFNYYTLDVFTDKRFGGNPLAVVLDAEPLSTGQMQTIAREFNYSETTFVFPAEEPGHDANVRIFTPDQELGFAGHPNIGTAWVLARPAATNTSLRFEELAGLVQVDVSFTDDQPTFAELTTPQTVMYGNEVVNSNHQQLLCDALSLEPSDICTANHNPRNASTGLEFHCVELNSLSALSRVKINHDKWQRYTDISKCFAIHLYTRATERRDIDICCRMFATLGDIREDPATGSANCALAGLLAHLDAEHTGQYTYRIAQGVEMGRPSKLVARVQKTAGAVTQIKIGGTAVQVMQGTLTL